MKRTSAGARLKALLAGGAPVIAPGCYDGFTARLVEEAGFPAVYMSGLCVAATRGQPDVGSITVDAMVERARTIAEAVDIPLIADADNGYGGAWNVAQAVRAFESAGVAAIHLEDQPFPKKCAAMAGKTLIPIPEMVARLRVAVDARTDPDFLIIARTDAFLVEGLDAAIERARAYETAGVDLTLVMSLESEDDVRAVTRSVRTPCVSMQVEGLRRLIPAARLYELGSPLICYPVSLLQAQAHAQRRMLEGLRRDGDTRASLDAVVGLKDINAFMLGRTGDVDRAYGTYLDEASRAARPDPAGRVAAA